MSDTPSTPEVTVPRVKISAAGPDIIPPDYVSPRSNTSVSPRGKNKKQNENPPT